MRQRQVITLLARPNSGWPRYARVRPSAWVHLIVTLSAMVYILSSSSSLAQELVSQGKDVASGQQVFNNACRTCHTIKEGDNRLGPNLYGIVGRKAGSLPNYNYSSAMKEADFVWDEKKLERFIANPDAIVPGHNMRPYGGLASADDTAHVIAFLLSVAARGP
jgi:cytochrome c